MLIVKILSIIMLVVSFAYASGAGGMPEEDLTEVDVAAERNAALTAKLGEAPRARDALFSLEKRIKTLFRDRKAMCDLGPLRGPYLDEDGDINHAFQTEVFAFIPEGQADLTSAITDLRDCYKLIARACAAIRNNALITDAQTAACKARFDALALKTPESTTLKDGLNTLFSVSYARRSAFLTRFYG